MSFQIRSDLTGHDTRPPFSIMRSRPLSTGRPSTSRFRFSISSMLDHSLIFSNEPSCLQTGHSAGASSETVTYPQFVHRYSAILIPPSVIFVRAFVWWHPCNVTHVLECAVVPYISFVEVSVCVVVCFCLSSVFVHKNNHNLYLSKREITSVYYKV